MGNEQGIAPYPAWNSVKFADAKTGVASGDHGDPDGDVWMPLEVDVTLKDHNWFWSPTNYKNLRNLDQLMEIYYKSVGRGGLLLLNAAPDTTGLIPAEDMALYKQFGDEINHRFGKSLASTAGNGEELELILGKATKIDHVIIQEDIVFGERVREYVIEGHIEGNWKELAKGISVGYKRIEKFDEVELDAVRVRFTAFSYPPVIKDFSAYFVGNNSTFQTRITDEKFMVETEVDQSGKFKIDLSDYIKTAGQYELTIITEGKVNIKIQSSKLILQGIETPGFTRINENGRTLNINITAHPSGGKGTIMLNGQLIFDKNKTAGRVKFYLAEK